MTDVHSDESSEFGRRDAIRQFAVGAGVAGVVWAGPQIEQLTLRPAYAAAHSGAQPDVVIDDVIINGANAGTPSVNSATADFVLHPAVNLMDWAVQNTTGLDITSAHIHVGAAGVGGGVVVPLAIAGSAANFSGSVTDPDVSAIAANPAGYYINLHSAAFPGGEIRGQLG